MAFRLPAFIDLNDRPVRLFGLGPETAIKLTSLAETGAALTYVSAKATVEVEAELERRAIPWLRREYRTGDLRGVFLAMATYAARSANEPIWRESLQRNVLFNAVDDPAHCTFILPSRLQRGDLIVAVSTNGSCPALAVRMRQRLEREFGPEYAAFLSLVGPLRAEVSASVPDFERRRKLWYDIVDSAALEHLANGDEPAARNVVDELVSAARIA